MIKEFQLPKTGAMASIDVLGMADLADVLALQDETRASLPDAQKMFVLPQPDSYFEEMLSQKNGTMIGIRTDGLLVSQMALMGPLPLETVLDSQKLTKNDVILHHAAATDNAVIAKSMAVHPGFRGNELSQHMLETVMVLPTARSADHIFAQISVDNVRSWELFLRHGFGIVAASIDPIDQKPRFIVQKPALGFSLHHMQSTSDIDPAADFAAIMRLTQREALIGQLEPGEAFKLAFHASAEMAATWYETSTNIA